MLIRDIKGIYLPAAYVMIGLSNLFVCKCGSEPIPPDLTGPTANPMICVFYYIFHLILWVPLGIVLVILQWFRYKDSTIVSGMSYYQSSSSDSARHLIGGLIGGFLILVSFVVLADLSVLIASFIVSVVPTIFFIALGALATMPKRKRIKQAEQAAS